jgi:mRNA-degrading endonuclease toxin of MazEF toxin-antitoxin module
LTTNLRRLSLPWNLLVLAGEGGLPRDSVALCNQVQVKSKPRFSVKMGELSPAVLGEVVAHVIVAIGL